VCDSYLFFLLVKLIKFFLLSFFILLPVMVNKRYSIHIMNDIQKKTYIDKEKILQQYKHG